MLRQRSQPQAGGARVPLIIEKEPLIARINIFPREIFAEFASDRVAARLYRRRKGDVYVFSQGAAFHEHRERAFGNTGAAAAPSGVDKRKIAALRVAKTDRETIRAADPRRQSNGTRHKKAVTVRNYRPGSGGEQLDPIAVYLLCEDERARGGRIKPLDKISGCLRILHIAPGARGYPKLRANIPQRQTGDTSLIESPIFI